VEASARSERPTCTLLGRSPTDEHLEDLQVNVQLDDLRCQGSTDRKT
jgi:hypothetical protein